MHRVKMCLFLIWLFFSLTFDAYPSQKITAAVSIAPQQEFVRWIGGNKVHVDVMVPAGVDPHTFELKPGQMKSLSNTQLYFKLGTPIEFELMWLERIAKANPKMVFVNVSAGIPLLTESAHVHGHGGRKGAHKHSHGEGTADPHVWLSLRNVEKILENITRGLADFDPSGREYYEARLAVYRQKVRETDEEISKLLADSKGKKFMVYHPSFGYFARDYSLIQTPIEKWGKEPTARELKSIVDTAKKEKIGVIFVSPQAARKSADVIASQIGGRVALIDPMAENYLENMKRLGRAFREESR